MGPIRTDGCHKLYFLDLYIPSYTPTLSALIEARSHGAESLEMPPVLLVTQPDVEMPNALQEMWVVQAIANLVTTLTWDTATPRTRLTLLDAYDLNFRRPNLHSSPLAILQRSRKKASLTRDSTSPLQFSTADSEV
ncbi:hypothetical protein BC827DRAFT_1251075 [Russula dissimulans]|nr:hypothetical protein BC827DRAFT_1251075 [Russula dissimulans]